MKKQQYSWPLALKLTLTIACVVVVVAGGLSHLSIRREHNTFRSDLQHQMLMTLETLAVVAAEPLGAGDGVLLQSVVERLQQTQMVVSIRFYTSDGRILAGTGTADTPASSSGAHFEQRVLDYERAIFEWLPDRLVGERRITTGQHVTGAVRVALSTAPLQEKVATLRRQGLEAALIATALSVLVSMLVSRTITKPLELLVDAANRLAAGGLNSRIEIRTRDELATLGAAMEHMRAELQELYCNLELEVSERTCALERRTHELSELNASKDTFFTILSHDLQTPISGLLELISFIPENLEHLDLEEFKETLDTMRTSLENFYELLKNLFTWSGIQRGTIAHRPQTLDIQDIVSRNISLLMPIAEEKHVRLRSLIPAGTMAYADPDMVYAIIRSLLSNALKFTFPGDNIRVSAAVQEHDIVQISIADTGVGIEQDDLSKLFRPDVTHQTPGTSGEEGTGAGLLLCKELVEQNGGAIQVESETGKGTTFRFTLPCPPER